MQGVLSKEKRPKKRVSSRPLLWPERDFFVTPRFYRPCWAEIHRAALRRNLQTLRRRLRPGVKCLAVVKANAYGHGLVPVSRLAVQAGASHLGVSSLEEGVALREAGCRRPILILGSLYPFDNFPLLFEMQLTPTVASREAAAALDALAQKRRQTIDVHLKIDSGFGRIGVSPGSALEFIEQVRRCRGLRLEGLYTHFASSDADPGYTREQARRFNEVVRAAAAQGIRPPLLHMANSSALLRFPETHGSLVRPGLAFYGVAPYSGAERIVSLEPALCWKTRVIFLKRVTDGSSISYARTWTARRPTRVATLAAGYADGYPRLLSNQGEVLLRGRRAPIVGRVTMDMMMADVTDLPACRVGDEAVLLGTQGSQRIPVEEIAQKARTNPYEILCGIASRVPRIYL